MNDETINQIKQELSNLRLDITKIETTVEEEFKHLTYRIDVISSIRMWIITIGAIIGGIAGAIKIIEDFVK